MIPVFYMRTPKIFRVYTIVTEYLPNIQKVKMTCPHKLKYQYLCGGIIFPGLVNSLPFFRRC